MTDNKNIRKAVNKDIPRIAEILVFSKRLNYRSIFHDDEYSFGELQVKSVMFEYEEDQAKISKTWVYDDGIVKGLIQVGGKEIETFYVEPFFTSDGIGAMLIDFAINTFSVDNLWVLEKNIRAQKFYMNHGFVFSNERVNVPKTNEYVLRMKRV